MNECTYKNYDELPLMLNVVQVAAVLGIYGDLFASVVKRQCGIKDYGTIFPGHGGILDRCDSLIYPLAFTWLLFCFKIWIFA